MAVLPPSYDIVYKDAASAVKKTIAAGTTLFHATAKAGEFQPENLSGESYFGVSLYHPCAVLLEHLSRESEVPVGGAVARKRHRKYNVYVIFEFETTRDLYPADIRVDTGRVEELELKKPGETIAPYMRWIRTYPLRRKVLENARFINGFLTFTFLGNGDEEMGQEIINGLPTHMAEGSIWGWKIRQNIRAYSLMRYFYEHNDEHALALLAVTLATQPVSLYPVVQVRARKQGRPRVPILVDDEGRVTDLANDNSGQEITVDTFIVMAWSQEWTLRVIGCVTYSSESIAGINRILCNTYKMRLKYLSSFVDEEKEEEEEEDFPVLLPGYMEFMPGLDEFRALAGRHIQYDRTDILPPQRRGHHQDEAEEGSQPPLPKKIRLKARELKEAVEYDGERILDLVAVECHHCQEQIPSLRSAYTDTINLFCNEACGKGHLSSV